MSEPYVGEIRLLPYNFAPVGWATCDGSLMSVAANQALFAVLGVSYGGNGATTFGLPDLRSRVPLHQGTGSGLSPYSLGQIGGEENVTLTANQVGAHTHAVQATIATATTASPGPTVLPAAVPSSQSNDTFYASHPSNATAVGFAAALQTTGGSLSHDNTAPTLPLRYCIAVEGFYPQRP